MDHCCGMTMVAQLRTVYTEGGSIIHDVPFLFCPTCMTCTIAPEVDFDFTMYAHYCETDGLKVASLADIVPRDRLLALLNNYPEDERIYGKQRVVTSQIDDALDLLNVAKALGDERWVGELTVHLRNLHESIRKPTQH